MILRDAILAWIHCALILALAGCLFAEFALYRRSMERAALATLRKIDMAYGILAGLVVASGISRVLTSPKGSAYYMHNPVFWTKMGLFVLVALLSIAPTIHFVRLWARESGATIQIAESGFARIRAFMTAQSVLLLLIPLFAALMARGYR